MTYQEAKYATSLTTTALAAAIYAARVYPLYTSGYFDGPDGMMLTGRAILILIGSIVGAGILGQILLAIGTTIAGAEPEMKEDERDKLIELKAMNLGFSIFGAGFLASFVALALGWPPFEVFHFIIYAMVICGLMADIIRIWLHRRGF